MSKTIKEHFEDVLDTWNIREYWEHGFKGKGIKVANFEDSSDNDHGENVCNTILTYAPECTIMNWPKIKEVSACGDDNKTIYFPEFANGALIIK